MSENESVGNGKGGIGLLNQFELILDSDPLIDEVGFIHPSQFTALSSELQAKDAILSSKIDKVNVLDHESTSFWNRDHKLGISMHVILPLYTAAKDAFMNAIKGFKRVENLSLEDDSCGFSSLESEVMKHSKALLLLSCDFGTAWNSRKLILSKKQYMPMFIEELLLSALVLSYSPKSEQSWCHRRWVIKMISGKCSTLQEILGKESELVEKIAERSKMNYRAWNHRCWLVGYMTREQRLMLRILEQFCCKQDDESSDHDVEICQMWQEELQWNEELIELYVGREALWLYRRFLSLCWIRHFISDIIHHSEHKSRVVANINEFLDHELCLVNSWSTIPDDDYEDFQAQAVHSATYILWLMKQIPESQGIELKKKLNAGNWKTMLNVACAERSSLWDSLATYLETSN
ncbi:protein prenyltransferase alpha subunit repeat-containing protein 1 isoform X2 [Ricinus communis]|uniref:protein prenyltransferase alpha subunit repeat-containing protein 1 isoform X2 n=1 Tax=Ricinus communis TaxID=3988 RepID=UPI0007722017|nr:protein prenyltransferase alpha subunit repeat-containing protein 1 isoform X2 [Ricinus communis]|eukprot:XP_015576533.1 protein prenyltransferase alpha subunit repeat-containing protein 1 isoform X2 [Ricinus communis]